jgi:hypothetical protein
MEDVLCFMKCDDDCVSLLHALDGMLVDGKGEELGRV